MALLDKSVIVTEYEGLQVNCIDLEDVKKAILEILKHSNKKIVGENSYIQISEKKFREIVGDF